MSQILLLFLCLRIDPIHSPLGLASLWPTSGAQLAQISSSVAPPSHAYHQKLNVRQVSFLSLSNACKCDHGAQMKSNVPNAYEKQNANIMK
jgi:hypothetical protein